MDEGNRVEAREQKTEDRMGVSFSIFTICLLTSDLCHLSILGNSDDEDSGKISTIVR